MRAAQFDAYGPPRVLRIAEVPTPTCQPHEVLVRVRATSINGHDLVVRAGKLRMLTGSNFPIGTGLDFAGEVASADRVRTGFEMGERVWGTVSPTGKHHTAAAAEYVVVPAVRLARTPGPLSDTEAAALAVVGATAYIALTAKVSLQRGERILVRGAAGGVGAAAVQLAHAMGAHVIGLASATDHDYVRSLGADDVMDYRKTEPADVRECDVILDTVGAALGSWRTRLAPGGRMVTVNFGSPVAMLTIGLSVLFGSKRIRSFSANPTRNDLDAISAFVHSESLRPHVGETFPLEEIVAAHTSAETGRVRGKTVITL